MSLPRPVMFRSFDTSVLPHVHRTVGRIDRSMASHDDLAEAAGVPSSPVFDADDPRLLPAAPPSMARFHIELRLGLRRLYGLVSTWERADAGPDLEGGAFDPAAASDISFLLSSTSAAAIRRCCATYRPGSGTLRTNPPSLSSLGFDAEGGLGRPGRSEGGGRFLPRFLPTDPPEKDGEGPASRSANGSCVFRFALPTLSDPLRFVFVTDF